MTPQEFIINIYLKNNPNAMINKLVEMAKNNNQEGVEQFARNLMKEKGYDFDKEYKTFISQFNS